MKSEDPFKIASVLRGTTEANLQALRTAAKKQELITPEELAKAIELARPLGIRENTLKVQDLAERASDQLNKWKKGELESVGGGKLDLRQLIKIFKEDPELAKHIGEEVEMPKDINYGGGLKNLTNEEKWLKSLVNGKLQTIFRFLKPELDQLPLASPGGIRETIEPTKYVREFDYVLTEPQRLFRNNVRKEIQDKIKEAAGDFPMESATRGKDFLAKGIERITEAGGPVDEALEQIQKIDKDRLAKLIVQREKFNVERQFYNDELEDVAKLYGDGEIPFDQVQLGHIEAVEENINRTLEIDNLFLQGQRANRAEQNIRKEIKQLKKLFN